MVNLDKQIAMEQIQQKLNFRQNNNHNHINNSYSTGSTGSSSLKSYSSSCSTASSSPDEREEVKLLNLDEFLKESGMDMDSYYEESEEARLQNQHQQKSDSNQENSSNNNSNNKNSNNFSPLDLAMATPSGAQFKFDPSFCRFTDDELRPQPMIHKSKKVSIPDGQKDIRYWARREKNNHAAKRSRDARRVKENQIVLRANFLEKENEKLRMEINRMKEENNQLKNFMNVRD